MLSTVVLNIFPSSDVEVVAEESVSEAAKQETLIVVEKTKRFFVNELKLDLDNDVKIILVSNKSTYSKAMIREYNISPDEAERRARTTRAWSQKNVIIQNRGDATLATPNERMFNPTRKESPASKFPCSVHRDEGGGGIAVLCFIAH